MASLATDDKANENVTTTEATTTDTPASTTTTTTTNTTNKKKRKKKKKKKKTTSINNNADNNNNNNNNNDKQLVAKTNNNATTNRSGKTVDPIAAALGNMNLSEAEKRKMFQAMFGRSKTKGPAAVEAAKNKSHKFWDTQPVPKLDEDTSKVEGSGGPVHPLKTPDDISPDPLKLPTGFEWVSIDVTQDDQIDEIYTLLYQNYVEDDDNMFRFDYSKPFLKWALQPPGYFPEWHVGVRQSNSGKLRALITGIPVHVAVHGISPKVMCEINFLCVHKKLRSKRVAPVLIQEVTRRVNRRDIWQAVYTAGVVLPKPVAHARYWHRSINPQKLIAVEFSRLQPRMTMNRTVRLYRLPDHPSTPGLRPMTMKDVPSARKLLANYLKKFKLHIVFDTDEEFAHWMLPREGVVSSYVVSDDEGEVTDLCSYYHLNSTIIGNDKYKTLFAAYSFYNVANTVSLTALMKDLLILSKKTNVDVFNVLDVMENEQFLKKGPDSLKFGIGDGYLQYYLYNWRCPQIEPQGLGIVLL